MEIILLDNAFKLYSVPINNSEIPLPHSVNSNALILIILEIKQPNYVASHAHHQPHSNKMTQKNVSKLVHNPHLVIPPTITVSQIAQTLF